jgi:hypothetical protein
MSMHAPVWDGAGAGTAQASALQVLTEAFQASVKGALVQRRS